MSRIPIPAVLLALAAGALLSVVAQDAPKPGAAPAAAAAAAPPASAPAEAKEVVCFESRKVGTDVTQKEIKPGLPNVKCSPTTGAVLWYGDPYDGTVPMGKMPQMDNLPEGKAVVKPRTAALTFYAQCGTACHNGVIPKGFPTTKHPVPIPTMEAMVPDVKNLQHGRSRVWCLDCHHGTKRNMFVDNFGEHGQHGPAPAAVRQVPRRQAARLARRHPRQAHRRVHQHGQEALVHLHRMP